MVNRNKAALHTQYVHIMYLLREKISRRHLVYRCLSEWLSEPIFDILFFLFVPGAAAIGSTSFFPPLLH